jgi:uncharacterized protein (TIGR02284 family)
MANYKEDVVNVLKELTEFVNDGREGYEKAAKETENGQYETFYRTLALQRAKFAQELNQFILTYGGKLETDTTLKGKLYRQWMDVKAAFTGRDEIAIISSNIYGEEWAQKAYNDALENDNLPQDVRLAVELQRLASQEAHKQLNQMKSHYRSASGYGV